MVRARISIGHSCWPQPPVDVSQLTADVAHESYPVTPISTHNTRLYNAIVRKSRTGDTNVLKIACHLRYIPGDPDDENDNTESVAFPDAFCVASVWGSDEIVGAASLHTLPNKDLLYLSQISNLDQTNSYKGIGTALMASSLDMATSCGFDGLILFSADEAEEFYQKLGLTQRDESVFEATVYDLDKLKLRSGLRYVGG